MFTNTPQDFGFPLELEYHIPVPSPVTDSSPPLCAACHAAAAKLQRCNGCKDIQYCSKECQKSDWSQHQLLCKKWVASAHGTQGGTKRRALRFFGREVSVVRLSYDGDGIPIDLERHFLGMPRKDISAIAFQHRYLPYWIQLRYDSNPDGVRFLAPNSSLPAFRGQVVAIAYDNEEGLEIPALDIGTAALGPVREYAKLRAEYNGPIFIEQPQERWSQEEWEAVQAKTNPA